MELSKVQKVFLGVIFTLVVISLFIAFSKNTQSANTASSQQHYATAEKPTKLSDPDSVKEAFTDVENQLSDCISKISDMNLELDKENAILAQREYELEESETVNVFNQAKWYNPIALLNAYFEKQDRIENNKADVASQSERVSRVELQLKSLNDKKSVLEKKKEHLKHEIDVIAKQGGGIDFGVISVDIENETIKKIEEETLFANNKNVNEKISSLESMVKTDKIQEIPASVPQKGKVVANLPPFIIPVKDYVKTSDFGYRIHPIFGTQKFHSGVDLGVDSGSPVVASNYGLVVYSGWYSGFGYTVILSHADGVYTLYGHNSELKVNKGDLVKQGQLIALAGSTGNSTGPHCHFSMWINNELVDPIAYVL